MSKKKKNQGGDLPVEGVSEQQAELTGDDISQAQAKEDGDNNITDPASELPQEETPAEADSAPQPELSPELLARQRERERFREERARAMAQMPPIYHAPRSPMGRTMFRLRRFTARHRRAILIALVATLSMVVLLISILVMTYVTVNQGSNSGSSTPGSSSGESEQEKVLIIPLEEDVDVVNSNLANFIQKDVELSANQWLTSHNLNSARTRLDYDQDVELQYYVENLSDRHEVARIYAIVSEDEAYANPIVAEASSTALEGKIAVSHLKTGTYYYFKIVVELKDDTTLEAESSFQTKKSPRFISIANTDNSYLYNIRDLGGWMTTEDGTQQIKQGMIFRGCELDGANDTNCTISPTEGVADMLASLGIRTVLDLRNADNAGIAGHSPLGYSVNYVWIDGRSGFVSGATRAEVEATYECIRQAFEVLSDESNYPIYIHDVYGNEEVSMICCFLETILGVDSAQRKKDYEMSEFSGKASSVYFTFTQMIELNGNGNTFLEKLQDILLNRCGVPAEQLTKVCDILLEDVISTN